MIIWNSINLLFNIIQRHFCAELLSYFCIELFSLSVIPIFQYSGGTGAFLFLC